MIMVMIMEDIKGKSYKQLIDILFKHSDTFAFVESTQWMEFESDRLAFVDQLISDIRISVYWLHVPMKGILGLRMKCGENFYPNNKLK